MNKIAICIPTYKRPEKLRRLVMSIAACRFNAAYIRDVNIIIGDNDSGMTAESIVIDLKESLNQISTIKYVYFPDKGLSNVRNELLKQAFSLNPDFLVFIDDDEYVTPEWLNELVKTIIGKKGDMVMGPVISLNGNKVSRFILCWIDRPVYSNNTKLNFIRTGNLIINAKSLLEKNIWFDTRFNATGGEDSYFGIQMIKKGATVYWAAEAIVYEPVPDDRATLLWLMKRYYNGANVYVHILNLEKEYYRLFKKFSISLLYLITGLIALVVLLIPINRKYWGLIKISEGMGGIAGIFNLKSYEYR